MSQIQWLQLIAGIMVLIVIFPAALYVLRQPKALRNAIIWLALLAAIGFGFIKFGHLLPDNVLQNMQRGRANQTTGTPSSNGAESPVPSPPAEEPPVRNL